MNQEQIFRHAKCQGEYCLQILQDNRGKGSIRPGPVTPDEVRSSVKTAILKSTRNKLNELGSVMSFCLILATSQTGAQNLDNLYFSPAPLDDIRHPDTRVIGSDNPDDNTQSNTAIHDNSVTPTDSLMLMSSRDKFLASVKETELSEGPYAISLTQQYLSLGNLFRIEGDTKQALEYYAKAEHNSRVNFGLYAPEQYLPIKRSIDIYLALHDYEQALERQEYLVYLHKANYGRDAAEVVPEMVVLGNMYFDAYERSINYQASPADVTLAFGRETDYRNPEDLSNFERSFQFLNLAQQRYIDSITTLIALQAWHSPLLVPLENSLVATYFLQANSTRIAIDPRFFMSARHSGARDTLRMDENVNRLPMYRQGVEAFNRMLAYLQNSPDTEPQQIAEAMLELGDWHTLFGYGKRAEKQYAEARAFLVSSTCDPTIVLSLLEPAVPVQLPSFLDRPNSASALTTAPATDSFTGYIDIAFSLDEAGNAENIEIMDKSDNTSRDVEDRLIRVLRDAPFRPSLGDDSKPGKFELRYHFAML